jgi:hypothetical protein
MGGMYSADHAWYTFSRSCLVHISTVNDIGDRTVDAVIHNLEIIGETERADTVSQNPIRSSQSVLAGMSFVVQLFYDYYASIQDRAGPEQYPEKSLCPSCWGGALGIQLGIGS